MNGPALSASEAPGRACVPPDSDALQFKVASDFKSVESLRTVWDEAAAQLGGSICMTFDWCRTWWEFYGGGHELRLFLCWAGGKLVGVLPCYIQTLGLGPLRFRIARLVGASIPPKVFDPPVSVPWAAQIFQEVLRHLLDRDACDVFSYGPVSELHQPAAALATVCGDTVPRLQVEATAGVHSIFWLPSSMEDYYASLSKNERKNRRKYELRLLRKEYSVRVDVLTEWREAEAEFERFVEQHTRQWRAEGKPGHFGAWPKAREFNRALVQAHAKLGRVRFIRLFANDEVIAGQYAYAFGDAYYWELPSREVDAKWERFSLGPTAIVVMIETAMNEGKARLEGGLAHYDYKLRLGAKEHAVKTWRIYRSRPAVRLKIFAYGLLRDALQLVYQKLWRRRLAPHLPPRFWRPQWSRWLGLDF